MVMSNEEIKIVIKSIFERQGTDAAKAELESLEAKFLKMNGVIKGFRLGFLGLDKKFTQGGFEINKFGLALGKGAKKLKDFGNSIKKSLNSFSGWALSIMFFGMAIQRVFKSLATAGLKSFKDITDATHPARLALAQLDAGFTFLKWSIGNAIMTALMPFIPAILRIVDVVGKFINKHGAAIGKVIIFGLILGTVMIIIGVLVLGLKGLGAAFLILANIIWGVVKFIIGLFSFAFTHPIIAAIAVIILVIAYLALRFKSLTGVWWWLAEMFMKFAKFVVTGIFGLLEVVGLFVDLAIYAWWGLYDGFTIIWWAIKTFFVKIWNGIIDGIGNGINKVIGWINKIINAYNKVAAFAGLPQLKTLGNINLSGAKVEIESYEDLMKGIALKIDERSFLPMTSLLDSWLAKFQDYMQVPIEYAQEQEKNEERDLWKQMVELLSGIKNGIGTTKDITLNVYNETIGSEDVADMVKDLMEQLKQLQKENARVG